MTTLTDADMLDLSYELNDTEIFNDVLMIIGEAEAEELVRGYDSGSIAKYGRRSMRVTRPILVDEEGQDLATALLDRYIEPYPFLQIQARRRHALHRLGQPHDGPADQDAL